jgi:hypothetical protein
MVKCNYLVCLGFDTHHGYSLLCFLKYNDFKRKTMWVVKINYGYDGRVNEQVIDGDYPIDGADRCSFCGMSWC